MKYLTIAIAKGRLAEISAELFDKIKLDYGEMLSKTTRKLIFTDEKNKIKFMLVKASDVPTYVEYGVADIGIVGKDTLVEEGRNLYEMLDLKFGACRLCVAGSPKYAGKLDRVKRVASKYTNVARQYFTETVGTTVEIIKLNGSVELGPLCGLSDVIVDIVESGKTLNENGLEVLSEICSSSARLVVNRVSMSVERERIMKIVNGLKEVIK